MTSSTKTQIYTYTRNVATAFALAMSAASLAMPTTAAAQSFDAALFDSGTTRIVNAARLGALAERIEMESCMVGADIKADASRTALGENSVEFFVILDGLLNGNENLGMPGAETNANAITALRNTNAVWEPVFAAATSISDGSGGDAEIAAINEAHVALNEQVAQLEAVISGLHANPQVLLDSEATVLRFAFRQRAMAYEMARGLCALHSGTGSDETAEELQKTVNLFQQTLIALRDGFPAAGVNPPPNGAVREDLAAATALWDEKRTALDGALTGNTPSAEEVSATAELADDLSGALSGAINSYVAAYTAE